MEVQERERARVRMRPRGPPEPSHGVWAARSGKVAGLQRRRRAFDYADEPRLRAARARKGRRDSEDVGVCYCADSSLDAPPPLARL
jgi:hypothetical protein